MPRRKHKKYRKPKRLYDKARIEEENGLIKRYGLKNKREIWKAESAISRIRRQAKSLITKEEDKKEGFIKKLKKLGFKVQNIADVLALNKEDYLMRRLQSILVERKLVKTPREARQMIVHKHVAIDDGIINVPSYIVTIEDENKIKILLKKSLKNDRTREEK